MYKILFLFLCCAYSSITLAQNQPLSEQVANYTMQVSLDPDKKEVKGHQTLLWKNTSADTVHELQYHLYLNAFKNSESSFNKERGMPRIARKEDDDACHWGWIELLELKDQKGNDLSSRMDYIQPDDDNSADQTVLRVRLIEPVLPYQTTTIDMDWISHIPKTMARTGYNREFYFMAQWFPKVGVYETAGMRFATTDQWNCHQYHSSGEYYGEFGNYEVAISVPESYKVGASGELIEEKTEQGRAIFTFRANDVIDFAWTASPHFQIIEKKWKGVTMRLFSYEYNKHFADRYFTSLEHVFEFFDEKIGTYPYTTLTIVNPPLHGIFCSGMEYPTLITVVANCVLPEGVRAPEIITIHEFIHQYFMQMVATNEQEEAWLDEGITNYYESRIMDLYYGQHSSTFDWMGITYGGMESNRGGFFGMEDPQVTPIATYSWKFPNDSYHDMVYTKSALALQTLSGIVGLETMDDIMRTYFQKWKFKHPGGKDFIAVANEVVRRRHGDRFGENMSWFFDQVIYGTSLCDFEVHDISNEAFTAPHGILGHTDECTSEQDPQQGFYKSSAILHRLQDMMLPVDVQINFDDGSTVMENWDGRDRMKTFSYEGSRQIISVMIDPERKIYLDKNFTNNSLTVAPQQTGVRKYTAQWLLWIQNAMQTISIFM
jgi:Peptidase family M1 domain